LGQCTEDTEDPLPNTAKWASKINERVRKPSCLGPHLHVEGPWIDNLPKLQGPSVRSWTRFLFISEQIEWQRSSHDGDYRLEYDAV
jgi:hypothetical protein